MASLSNSGLLIRIERPYIPLVNKGVSKMGIRQTLKKWAAYQQTVRELAVLDNRQLNDLGIARSDIQRIARDHAKSL